MKERKEEQVNKGGWLKFLFYFVLFCFVVLNLLFFFHFFFFFFFFFLFCFRLEEEEELCPPKIKLLSRNKKIIRGVVHMRHKMAKNSECRNLTLKIFDATFHLVKSRVVKDKLTLRRRNEKRERKKKLA